MVTMVRDGQKVWPTCRECGCRLKVTKADEKVWGKDCTFLEHYEGISKDRDARGCTCSDLTTYFINNNGKVTTLFGY